MRSTCHLTAVTCVACAGDGKTDDTAALQRAIAGLTAGGRPGVLVIEPGTYVLTAMINVSAPIVLRGAGIDATTLFFPRSLSEVEPLTQSWAIAAALVPMLIKAHNGCTATLTYPWFVTSSALG